MTFYLKYRPQTVDELDLTAVRERLGRVVEQGKYDHAYLFFGPRGTGKTSAARILAKEAGVVSVDLIEIDAASNRGIDDIRELRERVGLLPSSGDKKAYIIDEVHMLTVEAFNALLKTLEEPPSHVMFFLCTTRVEKLPETIVSRCVKVPFSRATVEEIIRPLRRVARREKFKVTGEVLEWVARSADGSFREAKTILEEAVGAMEQREKKIKKEKREREVLLKDVEKVLGGSLMSQVSTYVRAVIAGEAGPALKAVEEVVEQGGDLQVLAREILSQLRNLLLPKGQSLEGQSFLRLLEVTRVVEERVRTVKYSPLPQLPLEIAALELSSEKPAKSPKISSDPPARFDGASARRADITLDDFRKQWPEILSNVKKRNHGIVTLLSHCRPVALEGSQAILEVKYKFHKEQLEQERFYRLIEGVATEVCGGPLRLVYRLASRTQAVLKKNPEDDNIRLVAADDDLIKTAEEIFGV